MSTQSLETYTKILFPPPLSLLTRLQLAIRTHIFKLLTQTYLNIINLPLLRDNTILPTFTKTYACQPTLQNRIFVPKSYKSGDALLPLYLDIHGGGFAIMDPRGDDKFCSYFSNTNKVLVVSLDYPKAPQHKFPTATNALVELIHAVLSDEALPFDKNRVAIGGFSAGGNLSLSVTQHESLQGKIAGVVAYYPVADFTTPTAINMASRPKDAGPDMLEKNGPMFNWGYIKPGQDLRDPLLSVGYAPRDKLPPKICIIGCEHDMLCRDAGIMAEKLAGIGGASGRTESDILWEKNGVRWEKILGEIHGFDVYPSSGEIKIRREKRKVEMHESVAEWLFREVYS